MKLTIIVTFEVILNCNYANFRSQMNCGNGMMNPNGGFMPGAHMQPPPHGSAMAPPIGKVENIPVTAAQVVITTTPAISISVIVSSS